MIDPNQLPDLPDLMIAGPGQLHDSDLKALGGQVVAHYGEVWTQLHRETLERLASLLGARGLPYLIPGSGTTCLEAAALNLWETGETVVVADTGFFGVRLAEIAASIGLEVRMVPIETGAPADPQALVRAASGAAGIMVVHVETSTGVRHPIDEIARAAHEAGLAVMVDGIASAGGETVDVEGMGLDAFVTSTQKGLEAPPGLGIVALSEKGRSRVSNRSRPVASWYLSLARWDKYREEWGAWHPHPVTMPTNLVVALASSLKRILDFGKEEWIATRSQLARYTRERLADLGLKPVPQPGVEANLVAAAWTEDLEAIQKHVLANGLMISGGLGPTRDKAIRVGLMGRTATKETVDRLVGLVSEALSG